MAKILSTEGNPTRFAFFCPGCSCGHWFDTTIWTYNNDPNKPTIRASILVHNNGFRKRCHSMVTDGKIQYFDDSEHELKGQTVDLPDFEELDLIKKDPFFKEE
jgi:hypothetical protein